MELPFEKINFIHTLELENYERNPNAHNQYNSSSQSSKSTSENSENFQKKIIKNIISNDYFRKGKDIRNVYFEKLISKRIMPKFGDSQPRQYNSIILFDWDDTLFCSSYLIKKNFFDNDIIPPSIKTKMEKLEIFVNKVLSTAILYGDTYIVTNASLGWVEFSTKKYYPTVYKLLDKIKIISARSIYENDFPEDTRMWKLQAFSDVAKFYPENKVTNIICLGDSNLEIEAADKMKSMFLETFVKTIKFREEPKPEHIIKQLSLVDKQFQEIHSAARNISIRVEKKN